MRTRRMNAAYKCQLTIAYLFHLFFVFSTGALEVLQSSSALGSQASLDNGSTVAALTFVVMALPLVLLFLGTKHRYDPCAERRPRAEGNSAAIPKSESSGGSAAGAQGDVAARPDAKPPNA